MTARGRAMLPVGLYLHYPWCLRKCPYCDFFSLPAPRDEERDQRYVTALLQDFEALKPHLAGRNVSTVFLGGGTPSLLSPKLIGQILKTLAPCLAAGAEITLELNPGSVDSAYFEAVRAQGVNRLSIGAQSFDDRLLRRLRRIHRACQIKDCVTAARAGGFDNINLDLMHGLPGQSVRQALVDLRAALELGPEHLSWYELTLEEGTLLYEERPQLPVEEELAAMEDQGFELLRRQGFAHYEISAFAREGYRCAHNENYWRFHDYLGLGAGAHSKLFVKGQTLRRSNPEDARAYCVGARGEFTAVPSTNVPFEYLLNRLRLFERIPQSDFTRCTALPFALLESKLKACAQEGLLVMDENGYELTALGRRFLNTLLERFL